MSLRSLLPALAALLTLAPAAAAHEVRVGALTVSRLHVRAPIGTASTTAGYLRVDNPTPRADRLIGAACDCARAVELHGTSRAGGVVRMGRVVGFDVPSVTGLSLEPGGPGHLMLTGLRRPLRNGERVPITLRFQNAGTVAAEFHVMTNPAGPDPRPAADPHAHHR